MKRLLKIFLLLLVAFALAGCPMLHKTVLLDAESVRPITCLGVLMGKQRFNQPLANRYLDAVGAAYATSLTTEYLKLNSIRHCPLPASGGELPTHLLVLHPAAGLLKKNPDSVREIKFVAVLRDEASQKNVWMGEVTSYPRDEEPENRSRCAQLDRVHTTLVYALTELRDQGFTSMPRPKEGDWRPSIRQVKCPEAVAG